MSFLPESTNEAPSVWVTRWDLIDRARHAEVDPAVSRRALEQVILQYRPAMVAAIARSGLPSADVEDVCQEFLMSAFLTNTLPKADREKGRFRTFMLFTLRQFIVDYRRRQGALKRGSGRVVSIEEVDQEEAMAMLTARPQEELAFEVDFALCLHRRVIESLQQEYSLRRQAAVFESLQPLILDREAMPGPLPGMESMAVRQALSRLRSRYGSKFLKQVNLIIDHGEQPEEEMIQLLKLVLIGLRMEGSSI